MLTGNHPVGPAACPGSRPLVGVLTVLLAACAGGGKGSASMPRPEGESMPREPLTRPPTPTVVAAPTGPVPEGPASPGPDAVVPAFAGRHVYFVGSSDNKRIHDVAATFPALPLAYERITLTFALRCPPEGGCDAWDRRGSFGVVRKVDGKDAVTEVLRFMTPYRAPASWTVDVTSLRPLLSGDVTLRVFIDTWVGPGHPSGAGWLVDASFEMKGGIPERLPIAVIPLWDEMSFDYGDPAKPVAAAVTPRTAAIPAGAGAVELRAFITGHGQGNLDNCAEFCRRTHAFRVGGVRFEHLLWRDDCARTGAPGQAGNTRSPRAGWCPGADVLPWVLDVSAAAKPGVTISYEVQPYENSCRPDAPACSCVDCAYNSGRHTVPYYQLSAALIVYR